MNVGLLQRIKLPKGKVSEAFTGVGTFAGMKDIKEALFAILKFDYMGNADFELGALKKSLNFVHTHTDEYELQEKGIKGVTFFIIAPSEKLEEYSQVIEKMSERNHHIEYHGLNDLVQGQNPKEIQGWLDIDNHILFFINKEMASQLAQFLEVKEAVKV